MGSFLYILFFPFIFMGWLGYMMFRFMFELIIVLFKGVFYLLKFIFVGVSDGIGTVSTISNKRKKQKKNKVSYKDEEFDREADLWGLSNEDRRIAKEERMSPADYIEAEERDDDVLDTDEWE